jgi:hypothetical protein
VCGLAAEDFQTAIPFSALPAFVRKKLGVRWPQKAPTKVATALWFDPDVQGAHRTSQATGSGVEE